ncbi:MAG: sigma factor-like helix-turn-helix DNA-binding protein [Halioglobus sp.]
MAARYSHSDLHQEKLRLKRAKDRSLLFDAGELKTHQEVADILGVTRQSVQQTERKALRKLRKIIEQRGMAPALRELLHDEPIPDPTFFS